MKLLHHHYGKSRIRLIKVIRDGEVHSVTELEVAVLLEGNFDSSYTTGDNQMVIATDSMKNTIYALAKEHLGQEPERFGLVLAKHFLHRYSQVSRAEVQIMESLWSRLRLDGKPHPHSFSRAGEMTPFTDVTCAGDQTKIESGIQDLVILKSTASGFSGFYKDEYTTLAETSERILASNLKARWLFRDVPANFRLANQNIVQAILKTFAENYSPSVQRTLYEMGQSALRAVSSISEIHLSMPNLHCLLVNLAPFGLQNNNEVFVPTQEPHGLIEASVSRGNGRNDE
ncbi:MAG TPA: urate oxidase [Acidobacteriota bacterium]|jgi:urate oxidase